MSRGENFGKLLQCIFSVLRIAGRFIYLLAWLLLVIPEILLRRSYAARAFKKQLIVLGISPGDMKLLTEEYKKCMSVRDIIERKG